MNIEKGNYFLVEQGPMVPRAALLPNAAGAVEFTKLDEVESTAWKGVLFKALEVSEQFIASEVVFVPRGWEGAMVGDRLIVSSESMKLWPVAEAFCAALRGGRLDVQA